MRYRTCPDCGASLDPGEICDCHSGQDEKRALPPARDNAPSPESGDNTMDVLYTSPTDLSSHNMSAAYYAIIPAPVRYHQQLPANAKLLYGEISALCGREGFCWASNTYFANLYGVTDRSIVRMIRSLEEYGFIRSTIERDEKTGQVQGRKIYLWVSASEAHPPDKNVTPSGQNCQDPPDKNVGQLNINNNIYINRASDQKTGGSFSAKGQFALWVQAQANHWPEDVTVKLLDAYDGFLESRRSAKKPIKSRRAVTLLCNRLTEYSGGDPTVMAALLDTAVLHGWQSVYPPNGELPARKPAKKEESIRWL